MDERDLQVLRNQILRVAERDPVVRGGDPKDVRALARVHEAGAAVVRDADRHVVALGQLPGRVDAGAVGYQRERTGVERAPGVRHRAAGGEVVVVELHHEPVALGADENAAAAVQVARRELDSVPDRLRDVGAARDRHVDGDHDLADPLG